MHSPLLFIIFNRPDTTARVFARIREARPPRLYIAADGPRPQREGEAQQCEAARAAVSGVDWPCEVQTLYRDQNLGCRDAVSSALDWFFSHEEEGVVLEDDCLPSPDFFSFSDTMLEHHRADERVRHINGSNFQHGRKRGEASYYFSRLSNVWGWASWRRAWRDYDKNLASHTEDQIYAEFLSVFGDPILATAWWTDAVQAKRRIVNTWDFQLVATNLIKRGLVIVPNTNLISNIGFDTRASHTLKHDPKRADLATGTLGPLTHPTAFVPDVEADRYVMSHDYPLEARYAKYGRLKYRLKRWAAAHGGPQRWHRAGT
jgi:hypothetical protein